MNKTFLVLALAIGSCYASAEELNSVTLASNAKSNYPNLKLQAALSESHLTNFGGEGTLLITKYSAGNVVCVHKREGKKDSYGCSLNDANVENSKNRILVGSVAQNYFMGLVEQGLPVEKTEDGYQITTPVVDCTRAEPDLGDESKSPAKNLKCSIFNF
jgi:hypothetical protein